MTQEKLDDIKALHSQKCRWGMGVEKCDDGLAKAWRELRESLKTLVNEERKTQ